MKPPGPTERYWMAAGSAWRGAGVTGAASLALGSAALAGLALALGGAAGATPDLGGLALGAGAAFTFFSFSSPGLTGEGRDSRPRRCALPITALRLTPPSSSAIWLAVAPSDHIFFRRSIRSSVQDIYSFTPKSGQARLACRQRLQPIGAQPVNDQR